nr:helix-turn-helix transcriptional regulator [Streptomyces sp. GMY02]
MPDRVWRDPEVREALAAWEFGQVSRLVRQRGSLRQDDMAQLTGLSQAFLSMIESGARRLTSIDKIIQFLAGLGTPADLVSLPLPRSEVRSTGESLPEPLTDELDPSLPWTANRMVTALNDAAGGVSVERREFLGVTGFALTEYVRHWGSAEAEPFIRNGAGGRISDSLLGNLQGTTDELRIMDASAGSGSLTEMGEAHLGLLKRIVKQASYSEATGRALAAIVADTATQTGWFAFDSGQHNTARKYFLGALRAAKASGDARLGAGALSYLAIHGYSTGAPQDAVEAARGARERVKGLGTPFLEAMLLTRQARGHAKLGEREATLTALGKAAELCAQGRSEHDPRWLYWINEGEIHGQAGSCHLDLGDSRRAADSLVQAHRALSPTDLRTRGLVLSRAASAQIRGGDAEAGAATAHAAIDLAEQLDSARLTEHVHDVVGELTLFSDAPYARDLLERAATLAG